MMPSLPTTSANCYVKLGYFALALDAYQRALADSQTWKTQRHNAELMRTLLAQDDSGNEQSGRQPSEDEIDNVASDEETADAGTGGGGTEDSPAGDPTPGDTQEGSTVLRRPTRRRQAMAVPPMNKLSNRASKQKAALQRAAQDPDPESRSSGEAEGGLAADASQAAGLRAAIEDEQATEQWLNQIQHDPQRFLEKRIALELRRREAAGQSAPEGGSVW